MANFIRFTPTDLFKNVFNSIGSRLWQLSNNGYTSDTTPTFGGFAGFNSAGDTVTVTLGGQTLTTTVGNGGFWSVTPVTPLTDGSYSASFALTTPSGTTLATRTSSFTVDTTPPPASTLTVTDNAGPVTGVVGKGALVDDRTPTLSGSVGKAEAGDLVTVKVGSQVYLAKADSAGNWSVTPHLRDGDYTVTVTVTDRAGNTGPATTTTFTVDTVSPAGSFTVTDDVTPGVGIIKTGGFTNDSTPVLSGHAGTGAAGDTVTVTLGSQTLTTTVGADGAWSVTPASLTDGTYTSTYTLTDASGNTVGTRSTSFTVDTTAPASGTISITDNVGTTTGSITSGATTDDRTPTFSGNVGVAEAGDLVTLKIGDLIYNTRTNAKGDWSLTPTLPNGQYDTSITITDRAGNTSAPVNSSLTVDAATPGSSGHHHHDWWPAPFI